MDYRAPESVPLLPGPSQQQPKDDSKRSKLLTVCPFILGRCMSIALQHVSSAHRVKIAHTSHTMLRLPLLSTNPHVHLVCHPVLAPPALLCCTCHVRSARTHDRCIVRHIGPVQRVDSTKGDVQRLCCAVLQEMSSVRGWPSMAWPPTWSPTSHTSWVLMQLQRPYRCGSLGVVAAQHQ